MVDPHQQARGSELPDPDTTHTDTNGKIWVFAETAWKAEPFRPNTIKLDLLHEDVLESVSVRAKTYLDICRWVQRYGEVIEGGIVWRSLRVLKEMTNGHPDETLPGLRGSVAGCIGALERNGWIESRLAIVLPDDEDVEKFRSRILPYEHAEDPECNWAEAIHDIYRNDPPSERELHLRRLRVALGDPSTVHVYRLNKNAHWGGRRERSDKKLAKANLPSWRPFYG